MRAGAPRRSEAWQAAEYLVRAEARVGEVAPDLVADLEPIRRRLLGSR